MNNTKQIEKMASDKARKGYGEEVTRKGDKRNKTKRDRTEKRAWCE
ncbi:hypothetical protein [Citrobacter phage Tr1]|nr:hypothetical protein [Citrobacter phage Tr1]